MSKHTPGPWKVVPGTIGGLKIVTDYAVEGDDPAYVAETYCAHFGNATAIAETPNMLAALEAIAGWVSDEGPLAGKSPLAVQQFALAVAAKAKGE